MGQLDDLLNDIKEYRKKYTITENSCEADKLQYKIMQRHTDEEYLALEEELRQFVVSNPPEEVAKLGYCGESLSMICCGIRERLMKNH